MEVRNWISDGNVEALRQWLNETDIKSNPDDEDADAAQKRCEMFGKSSSSGGMSSLLWAIDSSHLEICQLLLQHYPTLISTPDSEGATPLHYAAMTGDVPIIRFLISSGATLVTDYNGETPLHLACMNGHFDAAKIFLERGADPNLQSTSGSTALHLALMNSHAKLGALLLSHPALDRSLKDCQGKTAEDIALSKNNSQISDLFSLEKAGDLVKILSMEEQLSQLMETERKLEEEHNTKQKTVSEMYKQLQNEEKETIALREKESQLASQLQKKTLGSKQGLIDEFVNELEREIAKTVLLEEQIRSRQSLPHDVSNEEVINVFRNLQDVKALMETVGKAFLSARHPIDKICDFLDVPESEKEERMEQDADMTLEPVSPQKNPNCPPAAGFLIQ